MVITLTRIYDKLISRKLVLGVATQLKARYFRSNHQKVFLGKDVLKICSKFTGEHPCRSLISIKLQRIMRISNKSKISRKCNKRIIKN